MLISFRFRSEGEVVNFNIVAEIPNKHEHTDKCTVLEINDLNSERVGKNENESGSESGSVKKTDKCSVFSNPAYVNK